MGEKKHLKRTWMRQSLYRWRIARPCDQYLSDVARLVHISNEYFSISKYQTEHVVNVLVLLVVQCQCNLQRWCLTISLCLLFFFQSPWYLFGKDGQALKARYFTSVVSSCLLSSNLGYFYCLLTSCLKYQDCLLEWTNILELIAMDEDGWAFPKRKRNNKNKERKMKTTPFWKNEGNWKQIGTCLRVWCCKIIVLTMLKIYIVMDNEPICSKQLSVSSETFNI